MYTIEVVSRKRKWWEVKRPQLHHWRIVSHGNIIATSETYYNLSDCRAVAHNLHLHLVPSQVVEIQSDEWRLYY